MALSYGQFRLANHHIKLPTDSIVDLLDESCGSKALAGAILRLIASPVTWNSLSQWTLVGRPTNPPQSPNTRS